MHRPAPTTTQNALIARLVGSLLADLPELARRTFEAIKVEDPHYATADESLSGEVRDFVQRNLGEQQQTIGDWGVLGGTAQGLGLGLSDRGPYLAVLTGREDDAETLDRAQRTPAAPSRRAPPERRRSTPPCAPTGRVGPMTEGEKPCRLLQLTPM